MLKSFTQVADAILKGKAGGYAVQGRAAYMVKAVTGSYTNVVGLPLCQTIEALNQGRSEMNS